MAPRGLRRAGGAGARVLSELDRTRIYDNRTANPPAGERRVGKVLVRRDRRVGVVGFHGVAPHRMATWCTEPLFEPRQQVGVLMLRTAAVAEDRTDERGHGNYVVGVERATAGDHEVISPVVRVDPACVVRHVAQHLPALPPVCEEELVALAGDQRLGLTARLKLGRARDERESVKARNVGHSGPCWVAAEGEEEASVAGHHPAGAEHHPGTSLALDVRDPIRVVCDRHVATPDRLDLPCPDRPEVHRQEEVAEVTHGDVSPQRGQARIQRQLVERVRTGRKAPVVARRQDVAGDVTPRGLGRSGSTDRQQSRDQGEETPAHWCVLSPS